MIYIPNKKQFFFLFFCLQTLLLYAQEPRSTYVLNEGWYTAFHANDTLEFNQFEKKNFTQNAQWKPVSIPHNWDQYQGYRRLIHGNLHGYAWYRKIFSTPKVEKGKRYYLFFEGVGSYATVWLNGQQVGKHAGGRTTFTLDVTDVISTTAVGHQRDNLLQAAYPNPV